MSSCKWSIPLLTILCTSVCNVGSKENIQRIEIKALIPGYDCDINQLLPFPVETDTVRCYTFDRHYRYLVPNHSFCEVTKNETVLQYHCVDGTWKLSKGTDSHLRPKRAVIAIIAAAVLAGLAVATAVATVIYCAVEYKTMKCEEQ
ncbi:uncharacterized protein LOC132744086, partial [Ruditapes philippinarum]|uniref:uncharacterized protein LOC132744086 n=1 Tax=Ruditapes philippinarum TaxID=129788 RepID=UPI00295BC352